MPKVKCNASKNWYHLLASRIAGYHSIAVLNAGISALSFHLVLCHESYSHERDFEWVLLEIIFFLLGRTIKVFCWILKIPQSKTRYWVYNNEENTISSAAECDLYKHLRT